MNPATCFFSEFLGAAILVFVIMAATDKNNAAPPDGMLPLVLFLTLLGLGAALGMQTGTRRSWSFRATNTFEPRKPSRSTPHATSDRAYF